MKTNSKNLFLSLVICLTANLVSAQYKAQDNGSAVQFKIKNLGFSTGGSFSGLDGAINFDPGAPANAHFDVSVDANSVNTGNNLRDNHLKEESYFDVKKYPRIHFVSTKVAPAGNPEQFLMSGKLTIKDATRDIQFPFTAKPSQSDFIFAGSFKINRKDFGIGGSSTISNELEVSLNILSKKQ